MGKWGNHEQIDAPAVPAAVPVSEAAIVPPEWWKITEDDLDCGNEERLPDQLHGLQITMLTTPLESYWKDRADAYVAGEMFVYFGPQQILTEDFKGPDVLVALNTTKRVRKSWVTWQEGKPPDLVIEILSRTNAGEDRKPKKQIYQDRLKAPEYVWFNPRNGHTGAFELVEEEYRPILSDRKRRYRSRRLDLLLVRWRGEYRGVNERWLRWAKLDGTLLPTSEEIAEKERQRADRLTSRLRALGIDPEE